MLLSSGCGTIASFGSEYMSGRELFSNEGPEERSYAMLVSADHGPGLSRDMRYVRRKAERDQRIGIRNAKLNFVDISLQRQRSTDRGVLHVGPVLAYSEFRFDAVADGQTRESTTDSILIGGAIGWPLPNDSTLFFARILGGPTRVSIPQLEEDENLNRSDLRGHSTRLSLGLQQQLTPWLSLRFGLALDTTALPPDAHLNDSFPISASMVNSLQMLTPYLGLRVHVLF
jgi:hypothetical protein